MVSESCPHPGNLPKTNSDLTERLDNIVPWLCVGITHCLREESGSVRAAMEHTWASVNSRQLSPQVWTRSVPPTGVCPENPRPPGRRTSHANPFLQSSTVVPILHACSAVRRRRLGSMCLSARHWTLIPKKPGCLDPHSQSRASPTLCPALMAENLVRPCVANREARVMAGPERASSTRKTRVHSRRGGGMQQALPQVTV